MITGFETQTEPLTAEEMQLLDKFVIGLKKRIGANNAITNDAIRKAFKENANTSISGARVRKIINHIRVKGLVPMLCANSNGYYVASNQKEVEDYVKGLRERIGSQMAMLQAIEKQKAQFENQTK